MNNDKAVEAFVVNVGKAIQLTEKLKEYFENHFDCPPSEIHWGHVGSAGKACEDLEQLVEFLGLKK